MMSKPDRIKNFRFNSRSIHENSRYAVGRDSNSRIQPRGDTLFTNTFNDPPGGERKETKTMAIQCKIYQDKRSTSSKLYYARAVYPNTVDRKALAEKIEQNCSVKVSDVLAVLTELVVVMTDELKNGNKVLLDDFGYFYIGVNTAGAVTKKEFSFGRAIWNADEKYWDTKNGNIKGFHCGFLPTGKRDANTGVTTRTFLAGLKAQEAEGAA